MRIRDSLIFILGFAVGGAAALTLFLKMPRDTDGSDGLAAPGFTRVLVASRSLSYGMSIDAQHLQWAEFPEFSVPPGAFTSIKALLGEKDNLRRIVLRSINPGEMILAGNITRYDELRSFAFDDRAGERAVSITVYRGSHLRRFLELGDRMDIQIPGAPGLNPAGSAVLRNIKVIAVDQVANEGTGAPRPSRTVTLVVTTDEAHLLARVKRPLHVSLVLSGSQ
jgi:pilus assembly protein CpaB